jgi:hypothetical protein
MLLGQGPDTVNLTLAAYGQWVGEGNTLCGSKIVANTLASFITTVVALLGHHIMDDPRRITRSGHTRQKAHPILSRVLDEHKLMYVERRTRQPITLHMIDIMMYLDQHSSSVGTPGRLPAVRHTATV